MEKIRWALFWIGLVLYATSFFIPGDPAPGRRQEVGATLFLFSAVYTVISCAGLLSFIPSLIIQDDVYPLGEIITGLYLGPLSLVNVPIVMTCVAWFKNKKISRRRWVAALLVGLAYVSFLPFIPTLIFHEVARPYHVWLSSVMFFSLYVLVSEFQLARRLVSKLVLALAIVAIPLGIALLISHTAEFSNTNSDRSDHESLYEDFQGARRCSGCNNYNANTRSICPTCGTPVPKWIRQKLATDPPKQ